MDVYRRKPWLKLYPERLPAPHGRLQISAPARAELPRTVTGKIPRRALRNWRGPLRPGQADPHFSLQG